MNNKDKALMRSWAKTALQSEGYNLSRDAVARFILKNVDDPYEGIEVDSVCIVKVQDEERVALRGETRWYLCETDEAFSDVAEAVEVVSELVPKSTPDHPEVLETEEDYRSAPTGTVVAGNYGFPRMKDYAGLWLICGEGEVKTSPAMAPSSRRVLRWGETL